MKRIFYLVFIFVALASIFYLVNTYALLETNASSTVSEDVGKWTIKINNTDISSGTVENISLNNFIYTDNSNVANDTIAPGRTGYVDIVIDPSGTDVAVRYDATLNINSGDYPDNIVFSLEDISGGNTLKSATNTYSGFIDLNDVKNKKTRTLRVTVKWNDDINYDVSDYNMGDDN